MNELLDSFNNSRSETCVSLDDFLEHERQEWLVPSPALSCASYGHSDWVPSIVPSNSGWSHVYVHVSVHLITGLLSSVLSFQPAFSLRQLFHSSDQCQELMTSQTVPLRDCNSTMTCASCWETCHLRSNIWNVYSFKKRCPDSSLFPTLAQETLSPSFHCLNLLQWCVRASSPATRFIENPHFVRSVPIFVTLSENACHCLCHVSGIPSHPPSWRCCTSASRCLTPVLLRTVVVAATTPRSDPRAETRRPKMQERKWTEWTRHYQDNGTQEHPKHNLPPGGNRAHSFARTTPHARHRTRFPGSSLTFSQPEIIQRSVSLSSTILFLCHVFQKFRTTFHRGAWKLSRLG